MKRSDSLSWSDEVPIPILVLRLVKNNATLHRVQFHLVPVLIHQLENLRITGHLTNIPATAILHDEVIVVVGLQELYHLELLHAHEVLLPEAELILQSGVELLQVAIGPSELVVGGVEFNFLASYVELVRVIKTDEIDGHDFAAVPEEDSVD